MFNFVLALGTSASAVKRRFPGNSAIRFMEKKKTLAKSNNMPAQRTLFVLFTVLYSDWSNYVTGIENPPLYFSINDVLVFFIYINNIRPNLFVLYSYNFINIIFFELPTRTTEIPLNKVEIIIETKYNKQIDSLSLSMHIFYIDMCFHARWFATNC